MRVLGLMSGTSLDGVDAAIVETDGETITGFGAAETLPYTPAERAVLALVTEAALAGDAVPNDVGEAVAVIHATHLRAVEALRAADGGAIDLIGFHGQTILHRPERRLSVQIGDPAAFARAVGVPVVADLRQADLAAGGQGAPLVPVYHRALAEWAGIARPVAFLNVGGVANLTAIGADGALAAFDTGPGNGLIDALMVARGYGTYDAGGALAANGAVDAAALAALIAHPFFVRAYPKSLDRHDFGIEPVAHLGDADAARTLTAFTARAVARAADLLGEAPSAWLVCGGGRLNPVLMAELAAATGVPCTSVDDHGLRGDAIEAEAIAFCAARSVRGLPITFPGTTGVPVPTTGGRTYPPA
ncbi:MAG: anhydro-N-acetylmuramic acid kinase [Sphingomonas fennica]